MTATLTRSKILVAGSDAARDASAHDIIDAVSLLRQGGFDADAAPAPDTTAARVLRMLDRIGEGVCLMDDQGTLLWANRRFAEWGEPVADAVRARCREVFAAGSAEEVRFELNDDRGRTFEMLVNALGDPVEGGGRALAILWDDTARMRLQKKLDAIDRAGRELMKINREEVAKLEIPQRLELLEQKIIAYARQLLDFDVFNIRLLDRKTNRLEPVISSGFADSVDLIELRAEPTGNGISGRVAATGRSYICADIRNDPFYLPGLDQASSCLTVPLLMEDEVVGIFNVESREPARFREEDRQFAEIFGRYVAAALHTLQLMAAERRRTTGKLAEELAQEISGPLNDIITDTTALLEDAGPALAGRLKGIIANVDRIRAGVREVGEHSGGLLGLTGHDAPDTDPIVDGKRVLVADDQDFIRETIGDVLMRYGAVVDRAADGKEAVALIESRNYDLVVSDIRMPHKNGYEVFSAAKERDPKTAVILITAFGYDPSHSIPKSNAKGLSAVLFKPFKVDDLMERVRAALKPA